LGIILLFLEFYIFIAKPLYKEIVSVSGLQSNFAKRNVTISLGGLALLLAVIFLPLPWQFSMPCEILPADSQGVYAKMSGILKSLPVKDGAQVKASDCLLQLENPLLNWDERRTIFERALVKMEMDQIKFDRKRNPELPMQIKRMEAAEAKLAEIRRKKELLSVEAGFDGVFQLYDMHLKTGKWLHEGEAIGELFIPAGRLARVFATESEVGELHIGDKVSIILDGTLQSYKGEITAIDGAPIKNLNAPSSLFDVYGGPLQTLRDTESNGLLFLHPLYRVMVRIDGEFAPQGRTGKACLRKFTSAGGATARWIGTSLVHELAF